MDKEEFERTANAINAVRDEINRMYWDVKMDEAREEGEDLGYQRGHQQGNDSARLNDIKAIMNNFNYNLDQAMEALNLDLSQKEHYQKCINQK